MLEIITCETAAREVRERLGFAVHAPGMAKLVGQMDACKGCLGSPRVVIVSKVFETFTEDAILALRN
jgi:hypothetical protein